MPGKTVRMWRGKSKLVVMVIRLITLPLCARKRENSAQKRPLVHIHGCNAEEEASQLSHQYAAETE